MEGVGRHDEDADDQPCVASGDQEKAINTVGSRLRRSWALQAKIGSILVHFEEALSDGGHHFDLDTARGLLAQADIQEWLEELRKMALVPVKRRETD